MRAMLLESLHFSNRIETKGCAVVTPLGIGEYDDLCCVLTANDPNELNHQDDDFEETEEDD